MVRYLEYEHVLRMHVDILSRMGRAPQALVREGNLRSALSRPQWDTYYESADVIVQAARLAVDIARAHGFVDGN
jgi:prophage maintenance system killer protein